MNQLEAQKNPLDILLTPQAHEIAGQWARQLDSNHKAKQVYLNTLAIFAVKSFLADLSYPTDFTKSQSANPVLRSLKNISDLLISNLSYIECCPILPQQKTFLIPSSIKEELRIAYIFVQFEEKLDKVQLLGFIRGQSPLSGAEEISLQQLEPIDNLIDYLYQLEIGTEVLTIDNPIATYLSEKLSSERAAEIVAQYDRIFNLESSSEQLQQATEILDLTILPETLSIEKEVLAQKIAENLAPVWHYQAPVWQQPAPTPQPEFPILRWLSQGIDELANSIGWMRLDWEGALVGARATKGEQNEKNQYLLTRQLQISGQTYELQIIPLNLKDSESTWRFQLRNATPGGFIPGGFKLKLLSESGEDFPDNSDFAATATTELYLDITVESGEGLILETEPAPDNYSPDIFRF